LDDIYGAVPLAILTRDKPRQVSTILYFFWLEWNEERSRLRQIFFIVHCRILSTIKFVARKRRLSYINTFG